jgi:hypothetical protein
LRLGVTTELDSTEIDGQRWLTLRVRATNPRGQSVIISPGDLGGFGFIVFGPTGGISTSLPVADSSTLYFGPSQTKEWLFDFRVADKVSLYTVSPGNYLVRGLFAQRASADVTGSISPP